MDRPLLSIIIPVHNEEETLRELYRRLSATASGLRAASGLSHQADTEFIFVDDGSTDDSANILQQLASEDYRVVVVRLTRNWGSHAALKAGLQAARGDCFAAISADLQDPPEMLADFYEAYQKGFEVVWGVRSSRQDPAFKKFWANSFYVIFRKLALPNLPAGGVDTFLISRNVRDHVLMANESAGPIYYHILWLGYPYAIVPYHRAARAAGKSKWSFSRRLRCAWSVLLSYSPLPLRCLSITGGILLTVGLIAACTQGFDQLAPLLSIFSGGQLLGLGIVGEYLWKIANDVRRRPEFCIREIIRSPALPLGRQLSPRSAGKGAWHRAFHTSSQLHSATRGPASSLR